ncbi:MAG: hypothetical protein KKC75_08510 [Nanoarchaeota archaeon]|nr:hypothetical protein [Nanoarchaeota archaeon]MBU1004475.1 hypothetical protein [Nanoarchaeota archaeon]MBU1945554.1 hypothetical protein [Nanoarchaeota archaeon]
MGNGIGALTPGDRDGMHNGSSIGDLIQDPSALRKDSMKRLPLSTRLLEAAQHYLAQAGIHFPYQTIEVREERAVLCGVPFCSELLVCAVEGDKILPYI